MTDWKSRLEHYEAPVQQHIVEMGIHVYEKNKRFIPLDMGLENERLSLYSDKQEQIQERIQELKNELQTVKTHYQTRIQTQHKEYQYEIEKAYKDGMNTNLSRLDEQKQELDQIKQLKSRLEQEREELSKKIAYIRDETIQKVEQQYKNELSQLQERIQQERQDKEKMFELKQMVANETLRNENEKNQFRLAQLEQELEQSKQQIDEYKKLYESSTKGIQFEKIIMEKMEEYNHRHLGNVWTISHVGQIQGGQKGDIQLFHKELDIRVLIDLKNKKTVDKNDILKFLNDVNKEDNQCQIGLLVATGRIWNKRLFDLENENKINVYMSNFTVDQVGILFTSLELAIERWNATKKDVDIYKYRMKLQYLHQFFKRQLDVLKREMDKIRGEMTTIENEYYTLFKVHIDIDKHSSDKQLKEKSKKSTTTNSTNSTNSTIFCVETEPESVKDTTHSFSYDDKSLDSLESQYNDIKGTRSNYAIAYIHPDTNQSILQYFSCKASKTRRINHLKKEGIHVESVAIH